MQSLKLGFKLSKLILKKKWRSRVKEAAQRLSGSTSLVPRKPRNKGRENGQSLIMAGKNCEDKGKAEAS
jgi:hypothetical protein